MTKPKDDMDRYRQDQEVMFEATEEHARKPSGQIVGLEGMLEYVREAKRAVRNSGSRRQIYERLVKEGMHPAMAMSMLNSFKPKTKSDSWTPEMPPSNQTLTPEGYAPGVRVEHTVWGSGIVFEVLPPYVVVDFVGDDESSRIRKKLHSSAAQLRLRT